MLQSTVLGKTEEEEEGEGARPGRRREEKNILAQISVKNHWGLLKWTSLFISPFYCSRQPHIYPFPSFSWTMLRTLISEQSCRLVYNLVISHHRRHPWGATGSSLLRSDFLVPSPSFCIFNTASRCGLGAWLSDVPNSISCTSLSPTQTHRSKITSWWCDSWPHPPPRNLTSTALWVRSNEGTHMVSTDCPSHPVHEIENNIQTSKSGKTSKFCGRN